MDLSQINNLDLASRWEAWLDLTLTRTKRGSVLSGCSHQGPLYVQKPFYPEGRELAHLYLLHPPGGMVSGDTLQIRANVCEQAQGLITTPGAGRVYRAREDKTLQRQILEFRLDADSSLEWLPLESIIYPGAITQLDTHIHLAEGARFIGWEVTCLGLPASGESFSDQSHSAINQWLQIWREGRLRLSERLVIEPAEDQLAENESADTAPLSMQSALSGLRDCPVNGVMVAGPFDSEDEQDALVDALRELCERLPEPALSGVTLNDEFLLVRYLGDCSEQGRKFFTQCWHLIRPELLGRQACEPRIWAT